MVFCEKFHLEPVHLSKFCIVLYIYIFINVFDLIMAQNRISSGIVKGCVITGRVAF